MSWLNLAEWQRAGELLVQFEQHYEEVCCFDLFQRHEKGERGWVCAVNIGAGSVTGGYSGSPDGAVESMIRAYESNRKS
jgi:hypothetical protein